MPQQTNILPFQKKQSKVEGETSTTPPTNPIPSAIEEALKALVKAQVEELRAKGVKVN